MERKSNKASESFSYDDFIQVSEISLHSALIVAITFVSFFVLVFLFDLVGSPFQEIIIVLGFVLCLPFFFINGAYRHLSGLYVICAAIIGYITVYSAFHNSKSRTTRRLVIATAYIAGPFFPEAALPLLFCIYSVIGPVAVVEFVVFINDVLNELGE